MSGREKFTEGDDYDSDNDDEEKLSVTKKECLTIRLDAKNDTVENICHHGNDGQFGKDCLGLTKPTTNTIYIGCLRSNKEVQGTFVHELTHFVLFEVFKNDGKPYRKDDKKNQNRFNEIENILKDRKIRLHPILQGAFADFYQKNDQVHGELIVRLTQIIVATPNSLNHLEENEPELLDYYMNVVFPETKHHLAKLQSRALYGLPMDKLEEQIERPYSFQMR